MPYIKLKLIIDAPIERVFDLSRSIDLHKNSMEHTNEIVVGGVKEGLINLNEMVTWQAYHLFKKRQLTSIISQMERPFSFTDKQLKGDFKIWEHHHILECVETKTKMIDEVYFESPFGIIGKFVNFIYLKNYMTKLLERRNSRIKSIAESEEWKKYLSKQ